MLYIIYVYIYAYKYIHFYVRICVCFIVQNSLFLLRPMKKTHKSLHTSLNDLLNIVLYSRCTCGGNCVIMDRISMFTCCSENFRILEKKQIENVSCITEYPMFEAAILTPLTLDIAYHRFCQEARERSWKLDGLQNKNR